MHEAQLHERKCFVTLTYDDKHLAGPSLDYRDFQLFMKRVRKACDRVRYFMCGEYGERNFRPHFHACLFGTDFSDRQYHCRSSSGATIYKSPLLSSLWPHGFSSIGELTFESAAYVARYVMKKRTGPMAQEAYKRVSLDTGEIVEVEPEFCGMSLKPGIGAEWFERYGSEVFPHDRVIVRGRVAKPPKYYLTLLERQDPEARERVRLERRKALVPGENTPGRLAAREAVEVAKCRSLRRSI